MVPTKAQKTKALVVATKCTSVEQFVATFHRFCDDSTFFVSTLAERPIGLETAFSIQLEDKTPVLRGLCEVVEAWSTPVNRFGRPGVRLSVRRLTSESMPVFKMLQDARLAAESAPEPPAVSRTSTASKASVPLSRPAALTPPPVPRLDPPERSGPVGPLPVLTAPSIVPAPVVLPPVARVPSVPFIPPVASVPSVPIIRPVVAPPREAPAIIPAPAAPAIISAPLEAVPSVIISDRLAVPEVMAASDDMTNPVAVESRAPGSSLVLPANPLMNLTDQSLGGFVDCALYEETGNFFRAPGYEDSLVDIDPIAAAPKALSPVNAIRHGPSTTPPALSPGAFSPSAPAEQRFAPEPTPLPALAPERPATPPRYSEPLVSSSSVPLAPAPIFGAAPLPEMPGSGRRRWLLIGGAAAIASSIVLVLVLTRGGGDEPEGMPVKVASTTPVKTEPSSPPVAVTSDVTEAAAEPPPPPEPQIKTTPTPAVGSEEPDDPSGPPVVGSGPCRVTVSSTPAGSIVRIDDQTIGPSPITFDGPCKRRKIDVKHPRYTLATKFVNLTPDKPASIEVPLARPTHAITIMTMPPGATISIAGNRAGTSPTSVKVMGFTSVTLTVEKKGYKTVVQKVYSKVDQDRVMLKLVRGN